MHFLWSVFKYKLLFFKYNLNFIYKENFKIKKLPIMIIIVKF